MSMRGNTVQIPQYIELVTEECCTCGLLFGITAYFKAERQKDHGWFYCPSGHGQQYTAESKADKNARLLSEEQERHKRTLAQKNEAEQRARNATAEAERIKRRAKRGVCPCCNRTFKQLAAHMKTKHPDFIVV